MYFNRKFLSDIEAYLTIKKLGKENFQEVLRQEQEAFDKPMEYASYEEVVGALLDAITEMEDENFGLHLGEEFSLAATGHVDQMMKYSPSLDDAFGAAAAFSKMISDAMDNELKVDEDSYSVHFTLNPNWAIQAEQAIKQVLDLTMVCALKSLSRLTNKTYYPLELNFQYSKPKKIQEYYRIFNCRVNFSQPHSSIIFRRHYFDDPIETKNLGLLQSLQEKAAVELTKIKEEDNLISEVKKLILSDKPQKSQLDSVAERLHITARTLQRKLKDEGTSFKQIDSFISCNLAKSYLRDDYSIEEISYLLGFSESSAFIRAFKTFENQTPNQYRKQLAG
ncbi:MAG: AraC family transcriptional regulator [Flavobacteriales bacterium]|nr:AraC family transcriptional regulator [Flavobacteriales bacterium]